jgi:hypothetical protein
VSFEDQLHIALDGAAASIRQHMEADLRAFAAEVVRAAADERERAVGEATETATAAATAEVRAQADAQIGQYRDAAQKHAEHLKHVAESQIGEMRKALDDLRAHAQQQLETARRVAHAEIEKARGEVENAQGETEGARGDAVKARADADKAQGDAYRARAESDEARGDAQKAQGEAVKARGEVEKARVDVETARAAAGKARADAEKAQGEIALALKATDQARAEARAEIARAQAEVEKTRKAATGEAEDVVVARLTAAHAVNERKTADAVERAHTDSHQSELSRAARLADAIRNLDEARGLSEVLERLAQCAGHEVDRAAILLVKGDRLAGWRLAGFGTGAPTAKSIDLSVEDAGLAGAVLKSGVAASRPSDASDDQPSLPPFARGAGQRHAIALPVRVGGDVVAVLYADAPRLDTPSSDARWPAVLEVLVRHASRVLEAMTVQQAAGLSLPRPVARGSRHAVPGPVEHEGTGDEDTARRYARLLLSEIRMYHEPIVDAGRRARDLMSRLRGEIDRARQIYEARVPSSVPARAEYFDQELVRTLADGDRTLLGGAQ